MEQGVVMADDGGEVGVLREVTIRAQVWMISRWVRCGCGVSPAVGTDLLGLEGRHELGRTEECDQRQCGRSKGTEGAGVPVEDSKVGQGQPVGFYFVCHQGKAGAWAEGRLSPPVSAGHRL